VTVMDEQGDRAPLSPAESLALIERTRAETRRALGWAAWQIYATWGAVWLVGFGMTQLIAGGPAAPLAAMGGTGLAAVWAVSIVGGLAATLLHMRNQARGVGGDVERVERRIYLGFAGVFVAAAVLGNSVGMEAPYQGAVHVLALGALYCAMGAAVLDDVQLGLGLWFMFTTCLAVAAGAAWANAVFALLGGGGFLVAAVLDRARLRRGDG
jgi:hypothetical protein